MAFFSDAAVAELVDSAAMVRSRAYALIEAFVSIGYSSDLAREHARHGFSRRVSMLSRCIHLVFRELPPDLEGLPEAATLLDATISIQAFVFNAFGALDNLAWIRVSERGLKNEDGKPLPRDQIGLSSQCKRVRATFSQDTQDYFATLEPWFAHLTDFRHALAHRIPLYIPPYSVGESRLTEYEALGRRVWSAQGDERERLKADRLALAVFQPVMKHSFADPKPPVMFHSQLLTDFGTVEQIGKRILAELRAD
jgi:hypothetical protein